MIRHRRNVGNPTYCLLPATVYRLPSTFYLLRAAQARSAADANMGNELAKQRDEIVRELSEGQARTASPGTLALTLTPHP